MSEYNFLIVFTFSLGVEYLRQKVFNPTKVLKEVFMGGMTVTTA